MRTTVNIGESWAGVLKEEFDKPYFQQMSSFLKEEKAAGKVIYPPGGLIFKAFDTTPFDEVKVVILGQDPYHGAGQAMGLSFSVPKGIREPPSLKNIFKELHSDLGIAPPDHGDLTRWAQQGVFLLNAMLTVEGGKAGSHQSIGWQTFTNTVIEKLSTDREGLIFLLWGRFAHSKSALIDGRKHHVLQSAHPSPLAGGAFFGSRHFSRCNEILLAQGRRPIDWRL